MFILAFAGQLENCKNNIFRVHDTALEQQYLDAGYRQYERSYIIKEQHKEYTVICSEFRNDAKGLESIVIIPEFLVPGRPYPVYVYLYAIDLYSGAPEKGQRWAAETTRKYFGLETFAHTTLGRALKAFIHVIGGGVDADATPPEESSTPTPDGDKKPPFPGVQLTAVLRKQAAIFLRSMLAKTVRAQCIALCCGLAREWFVEYQRFLL